MNRLYALLAATLFATACGDVDEDTVPFEIDGLKTTEQALGVTADSRHGNLAGDRGDELALVYPQRDSGDLRIRALNPYRRNGTPELNHVGRSLRIAQGNVRRDSVWVGVFNADRDGYAEIGVASSWINGQNVTRRVDTLDADFRTGVESAQSVTRRGEAQLPYAIDDGGSPASYNYWEVTSRD